MIHVDFRDAHPIYEQVKEQFRRLIVQEVLSVDEKLPSVRELAAALAINPNTIQRAYAELEAEGFIYSVPGKGSFASRRTEADPARRTELIRRLRELVAELRYLGLSDGEIISLMNEGVAQ